MSEQEQQEQQEKAQISHTLPPKITKQDLQNVATTKKGKILYILKLVIYTLISSLLVAVSAFSLITPNNFTIGGAAGLAIIINVATDGKIPQSIASFTKMKSRSGST